MLCHILRNQAMGQSIRMLIFFVEHIRHSLLRIIGENIWNMMDCDTCLSQIVKKLFISIQALIAPHDNVERYVGGACTKKLS